MDRTTGDFWKEIRAEYLPTIKVISALPGTGKTSYMFEHMRENAHLQYLYVTPLLTEVDRVMQNVPNTVCPEKLKRKDIYALLLNGNNIVTTHSLFMSLDKITLSKDMTLIIDEAIDCFQYFPIKASHLKDMLSRTLCITEDGKLHYIGTKEDYYGYDDLSRKLIDYCERGCAYIFDEKVVIVELSPEVLSSFKEVFVLTYGFEESLMALWLEKHGFNIEYINPELLKNEKEIKTLIRSLVTIVSIPKLEQYNYSYTGWTMENVQGIQKHLKSYFSNNPIPTKNILVTCPKDMWGKVRARGYYRANWLASKTKATNDYSHCNTVLYLYDKWYNPFYNKFAHRYGLKLNNDTYALTELIQFIFRSAIRNEEPITLVIPSKRMRTLFESWLNS